MHIFPRLTIDHSREGMRTLVWICHMKNRDGICIHLTKDGIVSLCATRVMIKFHSCTSTAHVPVHWMVITLSFIFLLSLLTKLPCILGGGPRPTEWHQLMKLTGCRRIRTPDPHTQKPWPCSFDHSRPIRIFSFSIEFPWTGIFFAEIVHFFRNQNSRPRSSMD